MSAPPDPAAANAADAPRGQALAAIDLGSNSFRLEIARVDDDGRYRRLDYVKETVRLGAGLDAEGLLTDEAAARGRACLARFAERLAVHPIQQVRAVATQTLREARNRDDFLRGAKEALGFPIEVISGREEARLIYAGVARLQPSKGSRLVIDIGGRSTEMILGRGMVPTRAESFQVGSVSLSMKYFGDGRFSAAAFRAAQIAAGAELEEAIRPFGRRHWREALGSSGTVGAVAQALVANQVSDGSITPEGLRWLIERCIEAGDSASLRLPGIKEDRRPVIGGGLAILYTLASQFGIEVLRPARGALRQGVIFDLEDRRGSVAAPSGGGDVRGDSVRELQRRFAVDAVQAERVAAVASALLERADPGAHAEVRRELAWAAALHEVGMMVSHHDHHRHSAYLVSNVDAAGFSQSQQRRIADMVLGQRGGLKKLGPALDDPGFAWRLLCLRLAVIACHARDADDAPAIRLKRDGSQALVELADPASHPRTLYLLGQEMDAWQRVSSLRPRLAG